MRSQTTNCEFCPRQIGGSTKSGMFSNYVRHCQSAHLAAGGGYEAIEGFVSCLFGAHVSGECPVAKALDETYNH